MTRMWMCNPKILCKNHLLGEHKEIHQLIGSLKTGRSITGHLVKGQVEPMSIWQRHQELVVEMKRRNYNHKTPIIPEEILIPIEWKKYKVDRQKSLVDLLKRCPKCVERYTTLYGKEEIWKNCYLE